MTIGELREFISTIPSSEDGKGVICACLDDISGLVTEAQFDFYDDKKSLILFNEILLV